MLLRFVVMLMVLTAALVRLVGGGSTLAQFTDTNSMGGNTFATSADFPPAAPSTLVASGGVGEVNLDWADNIEADLEGYNVYRGAVSGGPYTRVSTALLSTSDYTDTDVGQGTTYYYVVTAEDSGANQSSYSSEDSAAPTS